MSLLQLGNRVYNNQLTRRDFVKLAAAASTAPAISSCAVNPVTGDRQIMLMSEQQEVAIDQSQSPYQFSNDYGIYQDAALNNYIANVGASLSRATHRQQMPYSFRAVNANYINAYAFPGGSIAVTRGILVRLNNEAELAALLGHELGHVNARHTASRMSKGQLLNLAMVGSNVLLQNSPYRGLAQQMGQLGSQALLAHYSRDDERQADALGMTYMVKSHYTPQGMVGLMSLLNSLSKGHSSSASVMFSTHPMSNERYSTAVQRADELKATTQGLPDHRERFMDATASLRRLKPAIQAMEQAEQFIAQNKAPQASAAIQTIASLAPNDYAGLVIRGKYQYMQNQLSRARPLFAKAAHIYPQEAQAHHLLGLTELALKQPSAALTQFQHYDKLLPGNPTTQFLQGIANEYLQRKQPAANHYAQYLRQVKQGQQAQYAYQRLKEWGYLKPQ